MNSNSRITPICVDGRRNHLSVSEEDSPDDGKREVVFLFTPDTTKHDHYHIELSRLQAVVLHAWLEKFLTDTSY